jgi:hypothetical protein
MAVGERVRDDLEMGDGNAGAGTRQAMRRSEEPMVYAAVTPRERPRSARMAACIACGAAFVLPTGTTGRLRRILRGKWVVLALV